MVEKAASRPWSKEEDDLLRIAVGIHGHQDNWKAVAATIPGRNNKACRKRWLHSLSPTIKKTPWTTEEDNRLRELFAIHGQKWSIIARQIPGRTDDACSKRYNEALNPNLRKCEWTPEEDEALLRALNEIGQYWKGIGTTLNRSGLDCRNRFKLLERKRKVAESASLTVGSAALPPTYGGQQYYHQGPFPYSLYTVADSGPFPYQVPIPEAPPLPPLQEVAPFQFSSSSLSAALNDVPQPSSSRSAVPPDGSHNSSTSGTPSVQLSPTDSPFHNYAYLVDDPMLLDNFPPPTDSIYNAQSMSSMFQDPEGNEIISTNPTFTIPEISTDYISNTLDLSKCPPPHGLNDAPPFYDRHAGSPFSDTSPETNSGEISTSCSPPESITLLPPAPDTLPEHSPHDHSPSGSLLFSTPSSGRDNEATLTAASRKRTEVTAQRLSTVMPLSSDRRLRPYACGHLECWPPGVTTGTSCFSTSKELWEHSRAAHPDDFGDERPFRCALEGCGKSWKSLNGIQYHLQVSTEHFQNALSTTFCTIGNDDSQQHAPAKSVEDSDVQSKRFACEVPGCFKTYKNASGLRYHKMNGHPKKLPMQLNDVPPSLARDLPSRLRKMRKKDT